MHVWNRFQTIFFSMETFMIFLVPLFGRIRLQNETASHATCLESKNGSGKCSTVIFKDCSSFTWSVTAKNGTLQNVFFLQKSFRDCWPMTWAETKIDGTPKTGHVRKQISLSIFLNSFFSGAMFGSIRSENETEVPGTFLGNQNQFLKRIGTKWKEQQSTFWTIENLNQLSIFSNFQKLLSCSAVFANLPEILAVCAQKMGPQSLKIFIFGLPSFAECPQFIFGAAIFGRIPR